MIPRRSAAGCGPPCTPVPLGLAAASMLMGGESGAPAAALSPRTGLMQSLAGLDNSISPACQAKLDASPDRTSDATEPEPGPVAPMTDAEPKQCGIQRVCMPGSSSPVAMMVCSEGSGSGTAEVDEVSTAQAGPADNAAWQWQSGKTDQQDVSAP